MVHQWMSVRPFITWTGIALNIAILVIACGILLAGLTFRRRPRIAIAALTASALVATGSFCWNSAEETRQRRYSAQEIRSAAAGVAAEDAAEVMAPSDTPHRNQIVLLGLDGMDWNVIVPLMQAGELPTLARLIRGGTIGYLGNDDQSYSPSIWTTMFSGRPGEVHGLQGFLKLRLKISKAEFGRFLVMHPSNDTVYGLYHLLQKLKIFGLWEMAWTGSNDRTEPAIWEIASASERKVVVVDPMVNLPARPVNGALFHFSGHGAPPEHVSYPAELVSEWNLSSEPPGASANSTATTDAAAAKEEQRTEFLRRLIGRYSPDLTVHYVHRLDIDSHATWDFYAPDSFLLSNLPSALTPDQWGDLVRAHKDKRPFIAYSDLDRLVQQMIEALPGADVVIVSDHGWTYSGYEHWGSPEGIVIMHGPRIKRGHDLTSPHILDITPTCLELLDLPASAEMEGEVLTEALRKPASALRERVASYSHIQTELATSADDVHRSKEEIEMLRAMGYVE
jgi:predicted AlkP superfamily phosphohydrolase/phosphomutase